MRTQSKLGGGDRDMCGSGYGVQAAAKDVRTAGVQRAVAAQRVDRPRGQLCARLGCVGGMQGGPRGVWPRGR